MTIEEFRKLKAGDEIETIWGDMCIVKGFETVNETAYVIAQQGHWSHRISFPNIKSNIVDLI